MDIMYKKKRGPDSGLILSPQTPSYLDTPADFKYNHHDR